jgi:hypothetical protein
MGVESSLPRPADGAIQALALARLPLLEDIGNTEVTPPGLPMRTDLQRMAFPFGTHGDAAISPQKFTASA